jgi:transcriptional regulator with XRE-family HTH domain
VKRLKRHNWEANTVVAAKPRLFGQEIRRHRRFKDITQAQLAERIGCPGYKVCEIETRYRPVTSFALAVNLVEALDCGDDAEPLLIKAAVERGSVDIDLAGLDPPIVATVVALARRVRLGLDPAKAEKIRRLLAS